MKIKESSSVITKLCLLVFLVLSPSAFASCKFYYVTRSQLKGMSETQRDIATLSRVLNSALKSSFDFVNTIDRYTLGIASAILIGHSLDDIKPVEWDKVQVTGSLLYQDQPFNVVPIRGATMTFANKDKSEMTASGMQGEFSAFLYKLVPYSQLRLFPQPVFVKRDQFQPTLKIPLTVKVESKVCSGSFTIQETPLEPISVIAVNEKNPS